MKAVLISINPKWCELIASGKKTVEVRKTKPKLETPFKCYIYETQGRTETPFVDEDGHEIFKGRGQVIGEFVCDQIDEIGYSPEMHGKYISDIDDIHYVSCVDFEQMFDYLADGYGYGWHISDLVIYDKPKELGEYGEFYVWKKCNSCRDTGYESTACCYDIDCKVPAVISRPPQSWCYVEELKGE
jgi:predicted transcriptional regulator